MPDSSQKPVAENPAGSTAEEPAEKDAAASGPGVAELKQAGWLGIESNGGAYYVMYRTQPAEIPMNEIFSVELRVYQNQDADRPLNIAPEALQADARMPAHAHGMNVVPSVTRAENGALRVEGMLFHMRGHWEMYFDITRDGVTERAQTDVNLE